MSLNIPLLVSSFNYLRKYNLVARLSDWIYEELILKAYTYRKLETALFNNNYDVVKSLVNKTSKTKHAVSRFINKCVEGKYTITKKMYKLIAKRYRVNPTTKDRLLIWASKNGFLELVILGIKHGANMYFEKEEALKQAIWHNHHNVTKYLVSHDPFAYFDFIMTNAAKANDIYTVKALIDTDAKIFCYNEAMVATKDPNIEKLLASKGAKKEHGKPNNLLKAVRSNDKYWIQNLLNSGTNINIGGGIALMEAYTSYSKDYDLEQLSTIKFLIEKGANIHTRNDYLLVGACSEQDHELVKYLLEHGANPRAQGDRPFKITHSWYGSENILKLLLEYANDLELYCKYGTLEIFKETFKQDQVTYKTFKTAFLNDNLPIANYILENYGYKLKDNLLIHACRIEDEELVKFLISYGLNVNVDDDEPLRIACSDNFNIDIITCLLNAGANIKNINRQEVINTVCKSDNIDRTEIEFLLMCGFDIHADDEKLFRKLCFRNFDDVADISLIKLFLDNGTDVRAHNDKALRFVCGVHDNLNKKIVNLLLDYGANACVNNSELFSSLCYCENIDEELLQRFLDLGADIHTNDDAALYNACMDSRHVVKFLVEHGANVHARNGTMLKHAYDYQEPDVLCVLIDNGAYTHDQNLWKEIIELIESERHIIYPEKQQLHLKIVYVDIRTKTKRKRNVAVNLLKELKQLC